MPSISGTYVGSGLSPGNTLNTHETHRAKYGQGGYRTVATTTERNQIPPLRREEGMLVYVIADGLIYILKPGAPLTGNTTNGNWDIFNTGGGGPTPPISGTVLASGTYDYILGTVASFKIAEVLVSLTTATKAYGEKIVISKDHIDILVPGFSKTSYAILGDILCTIDLIIVGPDLILRVTNNEPDPVDYLFKL
jgi:hypothetical protein